MRDIIHPYLGLGGVPLREPGAHQKGDRETAEMEQIRAEILRLGALSGPDPDWRVVIDCAIVILRDQRKDLQVACYLAWGLFEREGFTGLAVGLTIVKDLTGLYWDVMHPPADRPKARLACLDWLAENLSARIERRQPTTGDGPALERSLSVLVDLEEDLRRHFGHKAPPFGHVRRQAAEYLGRLPGPKPALDRSTDAPAPPSPPPVPAVEAPPAPLVVDVTPQRPEPAAAPAPRSDGLRPTKPRLGRILTPAERASRRARLVAAAAVVLLIVAVAGGGGTYWMMEVKRVEDVALLLRARDAERQAAGIAALDTLPERHRAALLHDNGEAILDHLIDASSAAADRYALLDAQAHLDAAERLYPDSARLTAARLRLDQRAADLAADIRLRRDTARTAMEQRIARLLPPAAASDALSVLERMTRQIETGNLRNARLELDRLAALLPASDAVIGRLMPDLTALAFLDLAERQADRQHFTRSLQVIADGLTFLPAHPMLTMARQRYLTSRSEYLLRNTVNDPTTLDTLLVREAAIHLRTEAPHRFLAVTKDLAAPLTAALAQMETINPSQAKSLSALAAPLIADAQRETAPKAR